jgi:uncharacterized protein (TIGR00369 family)
MAFRLENYRHADKFGEWLGYRIVRARAKSGAAEVALRIREDHLSPAGRVHGGAISAFFDFAFGAAVFTTLGPRDFCSTVELKVNYLKPIDLGDRLLAKTKIEFRGRKLCVLVGYLYRNGGKAPVALATATFNVVASERGRRDPAHR